MEPADLFVQNIILENDRARLEFLQKNHFANLLPIAMEKEIWEFASAIVNNEADFQKYFDTAMEEREQHRSCTFAIFDKKYGRYAGCTRFANISFPNKRLEIGWTWYAPELQRTGINKACKFLLLDYGFEKLGLNRIELKTWTRNLKSQGAMQKLGAVKEGILRNYIIADNGAVRDSVYYSFIREEWASVKERNFKEFIH